jgi:hypothetical protein
MLCEQQKQQALSTLNATNTISSGLSQRGQNSVIEIDWYLLR